MALAETRTEEPAPHGRLMHFPISFFAITMGLSGLALAYLRLEHAAGLPRGLSIGAQTVATYVYAEQTASAAHTCAAYGLTAVLTTVIALLIGGTLRAIANGAVCQPE